MVTNSPIFYEPDRSELSEQAPIFITGSHRSGTTWVSTMLALAEGSKQTEEPFNVMPHRYALDGLARDYFTYIPGIAHESAYDAFDKVLNHQTGRVYSRRSLERYLPFARHGRLIIKDPIACMSSDWLSQSFDLNVLLMVRHPAAFTDSLMRVGWDPDLTPFLKQPELMQDQLYDLEPIMRDKDASFIQRSAIMWKAIYNVLSSYQASHPEWVVCRHEDLSLNPIQGFKALYEMFGLQWTDQVRQQILAHTQQKDDTLPMSNDVHILQRNSRANLTRWKDTLSAEEIDTIREITYPEWSYFYEPSVWN